MVIPKLTLDFTTGTLPSLITFNRAAATATVVNGSGVIVSSGVDVPRFDFNSITLACKGLLIEAASTNLQIKSSEFGALDWLPDGVSVSSNATTAPDGTVSADKIVEGILPGVHRIFTFIGILTVADTLYTTSVYAKSSGRNLRLTNNNLSGADFDLDNGTVSGSGFIEPAYLLGTGWYRCSIARTPGITDRVVAYLTSDGQTSYVGDGVSGIFLWGAQLEEGTLTSHIPTDAVAVTRNADIAVITGANFSSFWQANIGGVNVTSIPSTVSGKRPLIQFDDGTSNEIIALRGNTANPELYIVDGGASQVQLDAGTITENTTYSLIGWWQTNFCAARKDVNARVEDTTATIPTVTQARLGSDGTNYLNGHLATIKYYDRLSGQIYTRRKNKVIFSVV